MSVYFARYHRDRRAIRVSANEDDSISSMMEGAPPPSWPGGRRLVYSPSGRPAKRASMFREEEALREEIEGLKRDLQGRDSQITQMQGQVQMLSTISNHLLDFLLELEATTGKTFLSTDRRGPDRVPPPHDLASLIHTALTHLASLDADLLVHYEEEFRKQAESTVKQLDVKQEKIDSVRDSRLAIAADNAKMRQSLEFHRRELQSLEQMADSLVRQKIQSSKQQEFETDGVMEEIESVKESRRALNKTVRMKEARVQRKAAAAQNARPCKRVVDSVKEDQFLHQRITDLEMRLDREVTEKELAREELSHVRGEITRAEEMIEKFKQNLTQERKRQADRINNQLRRYIEEQRDDFKRNIANQRKKNMELERQRAELLEEEKLLTAVLQTLEKQLQVQMQKLPALGQWQQGSEAAAQKKSPIMKFKRAPDDGEMKGVKKQLVQIKSKRMRPRSLLAPSKYTR